MKRAINFLVVLIFLFIVQTADAQQLTKDQLHSVILNMDSVLFDAFNNHDLKTIKNAFAKNLEFYQDRDGVGSYDITISNFQRIFASPGTVRRELQMESLEIYAIPNYGAVETGTHKFSHTLDGKTESSLYKFVLIWQYTGGHWKVTRAVSVGH